ncbi:MAG: hypothetical protein HY756_04955 [Nitrospirae bacterium]|nr:hypothetical protein [Nitrospirota bacterium]
MPEIIFDNCVLSNFALSGSINVIKTLYWNKSYITDFVYAENMKGFLKGYNELIMIRANRHHWYSYKGYKEKNY